MSAQGQKLDWDKSYAPSEVAGLIAERDQLREQNERMLEILEDLALGAYGQAEAKARAVLAKVRP